MNKELIQNLRYNFAGQEDKHPLPLPLKDSLQLISDFFSNNTTNKLCLVFPSKEYTAQWISVPTVLFLIEKDFEEFKGDIFETYRHYKKGEKLILNNQAIVEWVGVRENLIVISAPEDSFAPLVLKTTPFSLTPTHSTIA